MDDPVKAERLAWQNRRQKPCARARRRADGMRKAARTFAKNGDMRQALIMLHRAVDRDIVALKLEWGWFDR